MQIEKGKSSKVKTGLLSNGNKRELGFLDCDFSAQASQKHHGAQKGLR